jgi:hypothetical protein
MKTKLFTFGLVIILLVPQTFAQERRKADAGIQFGIIGGFSFQTFGGTDYWGEKLPTKFTPGFHGGGNVNFPIFSSLCVQPGLLFSVKGTKQDIITDHIIKTTTLSYIELPLNILYRPQLGDGHLLIGLGPYAAYGIMGKERTKTGTITIELPVRFMDDASGEPSTYAYYKGFDAGANVFAGYELYNGIFFQLFTELGLMEINSDYDLSNDQTSKNNFGFGVSVGYRFY